MTEPHVHLVAAARVLVQWGRKRQNVWRDGSSDLLAALGNRYAAFEELTPEPSSPLAALLEPTTEPERSPWDALASFPESERTPAWAQVPLSADVEPPSPAPAPVPVMPPPPASYVAPPPTPPVTMAPVAPVFSAPAPAPPQPSTAAAAAVMPKKKDTKKTKTVSPGSTTQPATRRRLSLTHVVLAAGVIVAAVASPSVWRAYHTPPPVVAPTTNGVTIDSYPTGSQVLIDGIDVGKTPFTTTLTIGRHAVELRYRKNVRKLDVDVTAGEPVVARVEWTKKPAPKKRAASPSTVADDNDSATATTAASGVSPATPSTPSAPTAPPASATSTHPASAAATSTGSESHEPAATRHQLDATTAPAVPAGAGDSQPVSDTSAR